MKEYTEKELLNKAAAYCASAEHCAAEVEAKLLQWGATPEAVTHILEWLEREKYIDSARFCRFFVRDKYRFNQWGRNKIIQALKMKGFASAAIEEGLTEIDAEEYASILARLLKQKSASVKSGSTYERNAKLIRFAAGRGFTMQEILSHLPEADAYDAFVD